MSSLVPADDRGLNYGEGLFETIRVADGHAPLLSFHQARMVLGCQRLGLSISPARIAQRLQQAVRECATGDRVLKVMVTGGSGPRGYAAPRQAQPRWLIRDSQWRARPETLYQDGIVTGVCQQRFASQPALAGIKHLNRLEQVRAAGQVRDRGWDEGLMLDSLGRPVEWTSMNLLARFGDQLWLPPVDRQGVAGVARSWLLTEWLPSSSYTVSERPRALAELRHADELIACNSVAGFLPVRKLAVWQWERFELSHSLQHTFSGLFGH